MAFCIAAESGNLYFDWLSFAETCQKIFEQITSFLEEANGGFANKSGPATVAPVFEVLNEAKNHQLDAEDLKMNVPAYLREKATGIIKSWDIIQNTTRKGVKVFLKDGGELEEHADLKAWVGDQELFRVMWTSISESSYPSFPQSVVDKLYKNWLEEDMNRSAVIGKNNNKQESPAGGSSFVR
jgi:hypothetical protein